MKKIVVILLLLLSLTLCAKGRKEDTYDLKWKINDIETLIYKTIMHVTDKADVSIEDLFKDIKQLEGEDYSYFEKEMEKINKDFKNSKMKSFLYIDKKNIIQMKLIAEFDSVKDYDSILKKVIELNDGVMLRGSINPDGSIHSFWLKSGQKNLISMFFELPSKPVSIGESWKLDVNYIGNDQSFICKDSSKVNKAVLVDVINRDGKEIALLKYDIEEYVLGDLNMSFSEVSENKEIKMLFKYNAVAEFSITDGRWIKYEGILRQEISGYMDSSVTQKISLIPDE